MAVPAYTTDLTTNNIFLDGSTTWTLIGGGRVTDVETDDYIQGSSCWSHDPFSSGIEGGVWNSSQTITSGNVVLFWLKCDVVATLATRAAGGMQAVIGSSATAYKCWYVRGSDDYAAGGWVNVAIDPTVTASTTVGSPTSTTAWFGARWNVPSTGASKGYPMKVDAMRQGRGQLLINGGQTGSLATFAGAAAANDASSAKWGLFEAQEGGAAGYRWKGLMSFGPTSLTEFTDANVNIFIENTPYVGASFNRIEFNNASSIINWTNISITALGTTSKGQLEMINNCTFNDTDGVFTDMDTFIYQSNGTVTGKTYRRCGQVTQGGATFTDCLFTNSTAAVALLVDDLSLVTGCRFVSSGTGHAVNLGTVSATTAMSWSNTESGYAIQSGTAANRTILVNVASGQTLTINVGTGASTPTYYNTGTGTVTVVASFDHVLEGLELNTEVTYVTAGTATELFHVEEATTSDGSGKYKTTYSHGGGASVDILIHHVNYLPDISNIYGLTLPSANTTVKIQMFEDVNYHNP